jgi:signal transduction histidine kinase
VVRFDAPATLPPLPSAVEVAVYRIAQEATAKVVHHARARNLLVAVRVGAAVELIVQDDGVGIGAGHPNGLGLSSMTERAEELGGSLVVGPAPRSGTRLVARLPIAPESSAPTARSAGQAP